MKKHLFRTLILFCGLVLLSSCMKDDPKNNETVYYAYQHIPNINEFMPQRLLQSMGSSNLYYGDEPPKMEDLYIADNIFITDIIKVPSSTWRNTPTPIPTPQYFDFYEQHKGITKLHFRYPKGTVGEYDYFLEKSETDTTDFLMKDRIQDFIDDTISPIYFKDGKLTEDDFRTVYIMGSDPYFTAYYYEIRDIKSKAEPLNAVVFSGRIDKEITVVTDTVNHTTDTIEARVIKNLKWGIQTMKYLNAGTSINQIIQLGYLPTPGDIMILKNEGTAHTGEFHE